jgi:hypothetical protein
VFRLILTNVVLLSWLSGQCEAQTFSSCFHGVFVPCTKRKCRAKSTVSGTITACTTKLVTALTLRACTSNALIKCAGRPGAKSTFMCNRAVQNYKVSPTVVREKNACIAMKTPCQELMRCDACGQNKCTPVKPPTNAPVTELLKPPTKSPVKPPVKSPTKAPVKAPTKAPVKPPTNAPVKLPTKAPVKPPTKAPVKPPTKAPVKPPTKAPVKLPTKAPVKSPTKAPAVMSPTKAPVVPKTRAPTKRPTPSPLTVVADTSPPGNIDDCTTAECRQRATCCSQNGGTLRSGGCINCLPLVYGGFYRCGFCDASAFPGNKESCASFAVGSDWLTCEMASGDTCNVQHCSWSGLPAINDCPSTC